MRWLLAFIALAMTVLSAGIALFVYSGAYDVSATKPHLPPVYHLLVQTMRHSIKRHSAGIAEPEIFDAHRAARGLALYRTHCVKCHGAPGVAPNAESFGLYPPPPNLVDVVRTWPLREIFHTIKHGIKMTGMPAWHYRLADDQIWDIVAFLQKLPGVSPAEYAGLGERPAQVAASVPQGAREPEAERTPDAAAGRRAIDKYLCATCHRIARVTGADKDVGPPLDGLARRRYIAGSLLNTPESLARWLEHPQLVRPGSAMPELGVSAADARDIAAFLYTLD